VEPEVTAGIVAGGVSARMGRNKALLPFGGRPLLLRQIDLLRPRFRLLVASNDPGPYAPFGVEVVPDLLPERCALTGIHAVLSASRTGWALVLACDLPFLSAALLDHLLRLRDGVDAVVPESDRGPEPLHALYSKTCLPAIEAAAEKDEWKAVGFHGSIRVARPRIRDAEWLTEGRSPFLNVNTPDDYGRAAT
jgi:molybdopterin-guanine dinucleotide biosynthesis protein A